MTTKIEDQTQITTCITKSADTYISLVKTDLQEGQWDQAIKNCNQAIIHDPKSSYIYNLRGVAYAKKREWDKAIKDCDKAIKFNPENSDAYHLRGATYFQKIKWDKAIVDLDKAIEFNPQNLDAHHLRGNAHLQKEKWDQAIADFDRAMKLDPKNSHTYYRRGFAYLRKGEWDQAITDLNQAIKLGPKNADAYFSRGIAYAKQEQWDSSIADFDQATAYFDTAIKFNPKKSYTSHARGFVYFQKREWSKAFADFNKAIDWDPENARAYFSRGIAYARKEEWDKSIADLNIAIELNPQSPETFHLRGLVYTQKREWNQAFADLLQVDEFDPTLKSRHTHIYIASQIKHLTSGTPKTQQTKIIKNYFELLMTIENIQDALFYQPQGSEVAHYTPLDTLKNLIGNAANFRFYNSTYIDDQEEGHIFFDVMKNIAGESKIDLEDIFYTEAEDKQYHSPAYISNFVKLDTSEPRDKLSLWQAYGRHNDGEAASGCLIFPRTNFAENPRIQVGAMRQHTGAGTKLEWQLNNKPPIYKIIYPDTELPKNLSDQLSELPKCLQEIEKIIRKNIKKDDTKDKFKQLARELLDGIRFLFKAGKYREEQEIRIIQFCYNEEDMSEDSDAIKIDMEKTPPRFYLEPPQNFRCNEVIIGPKTKNFRGWKWWIKKQDADITVTKSKIKYEKNDA